MRKHKKAFEKERGRSAHGCNKEERGRVWDNPEAKGGIRTAQTVSVKGNAKQGGVKGFPNKRKKTEGSPRKRGKKQTKRKRGKGNRHMEGKKGRV